MKATAAPLPIALDYRPALLSPAGIGRATRELSRALAERDDVVVHLFGHSLARARCVAALPPRAILHRLPIPGRSLPALARLGLAAERLAGGARVFHWTDFVQPPVGKAAKVLTVHDLAFVREPKWHGAAAGTLRERTLAAIAQCAAVIVPSQATAVDVRAFAPTTVHVVPFGADHVPQTVAADHPFGGRPYVLCLGTIEPRKNHRALLRAMLEIQGPRPLLVVVGGIGWDSDETVRALGAAVDDGLVVWKEHANDREVWALLHHAGVLAYPSLWEGFGFPVLEAMAMGTPVVAHRCAPLEELTSGAATLTDATSPAALAEAIERTLRDRALRAKLVDAGRARAGLFLWRDCATAHAAIYREVAH